MSRCIHPARDGLDGRGCQDEACPVHGGEPIPCRCEVDANGDLIPNGECELHWHQVIDGGDEPPAWAFP